MATTQVLALLKPHFPTLTEFKDKIIRKLLKGKQQSISTQIRVCRER